MKGKNLQTYTKRGSNREEMVPEWFFKKDEKKKEQPKKSNPDIEERRRKLLEEFELKKKWGEVKWNQ